MKETHEDSVRPDFIPFKETMFYYSMLWKNLWKERHIWPKAQRYIF